MKKRTCLQTTRTQINVRSTDATQKGYSNHTTGKLIVAHLKCSVDCHDTQ